jgi:hypothetical protein
MGFELVFEGLSDNGSSVQGMAPASFQVLLNFVNNRRGQYEPWLFQDPDFGTASAAYVGTGNGSQKDFTFPVPWAGPFVPAGEVNPATVNVHLNGSPAGGWSVTLPNTVHFLSPPASTVVITADYAWYWLVAFDEDTEDFEQFLAGLHAVGALRFSSIKF